MSANKLYGHCLEMSAAYVYSLKGKLVIFVY